MTDLTPAAQARDWLIERVGAEHARTIDRHIVAIEAEARASAAAEMADKFETMAAAWQAAVEDRAEAAAEIAALRVSVTGLRATAAEQVLTAINAEDDSVPFYEGQVYAYDEILRRLADTAPAAEDEP